MPSIMKTITDLIDRNDRYDFNKITFYTKTDVGDLIIHDDDLFRIYYRFISSYIGTYAIDLQQRMHYRGRPDLLAQDIYGTPELAWMILMINDKESPSKFFLKSTVRLISPENLSTIYDTILTRSTERLNQNWNEYLTQIIVEDDSE